MSRPQEASSDDERDKVWMHKCRHQGIFVGTDRVRCPFCGKTREQAAPEKEETDEERNG